MKNLLLIGASLAFAILALSIQGCKKEKNSLTFWLEKNGECTLNTMNYTKDDILYFPTSLDVERWSAKGKALSSINLDVYLEKRKYLLPGEVDMVTYRPTDIDIGPKNIGEKWVITAEIEWKKGAKQKETGWKILGGGDWDPTKDQVR